MAEIFDLITNGAKFPFEYLMALIALAAMALAAFAIHAIYTLAKRRDG